MYKRPYLAQLAKKVKEPRKFIQVITGPRQVGKTTLVLQLLEKINVPSRFFSADADFANSTWLKQQWEAVRVELKQRKAKEFILVIDEIQKIEQWSEHVKRLWDEDTRSRTPLKVILLGSSRLQLQQGLTESLAGRFESHYLGHWSYIEMRDAFKWKPDQYVWFGGYPGAADLIKDETRWKNYLQHSMIETSVSKDILMLTRIDKPALLRRLFTIGCLYSSQILSFTKLLGWLHDAGNTTTLAHYLELLDSAGMLGGLEKYSGTVLRKRTSIPKFQVYNTAFISSQRSETFREIKKNPTEWGRLVESAVGAHLLNFAKTGNFNVYYWREGNDEVDFVIQRKKKIIALEVKSSVAKSKTGMVAFEKKFKPDKVLLIGEGGIPWQDFLTIHPETLFD